MTAIANLPDLRPSLLLDFANSGRVDPRIQCTRASAATCFGPDGKLRTVVANVPRIDYDPMTGKCLGLLVEESRSNLFSGSAQPVTAMTARTGIAVGTTSEIVPFSGAIASFMEETATTGGHYMERTIGNAASAPMSFSLYVKAVGRKDVWLSLYSNSYADFAHGRFDLTAKNASVLVGGSASGAVAQIAEVSPGWFRLSITATPSAQTVTDLKVRIAAINSSTTYAGEVGKGFLTFGAQVEAGAFPTSYIPTEASAVTRASESLYTDVSTAWYNSTGGTLFAEAIAPNGIQLFARPASLERPGVNVLSIQRVQDATGNGTARGYFEGASLVAGAASFPPSVPVKVALAGAPGDFALSASGSIFTSNLGVLGVPTQLRLGTSISGLSALNGVIQRVAYYPSRLPNAQLQRLTA